MATYKNINHKIDPAHFVERLSKSCVGYLFRHLRGAQMDNSRNLFQHIPLNSLLLENMNMGELVGNALEN